MRATITTTWAILLLLAAGGAGAQPVWRCGNSYSQQPCPGGSPMNVADSRTPREAARSSSVAQAEMKLADKMEKERLEREKNAPKALVIGPPPQPAAPASAAHGKHAKKGRNEAPHASDVFTATSPRPAKAKKKT